MNPLFAYNTLHKLKLYVVLLVTIALNLHTAQAQLTYTKQLNPYHTVIAEGWLNANNQKIKYWKYYHDNGKVKEAGHYTNGKKTNYWYTYDALGNTISEGHYTNDKKTSWWIYYSNNKVLCKTEYYEDNRNGYSLVYNNNDVVRIEQYKDNKKIKEWTDKASFKRDNPKYFFL